MILTLSSISTMPGCKCWSHNLGCGHLQMFNDLKVKNSIICNVQLFDLIWFESKKCWIESEIHFRPLDNFLYSVIWIDFGKKNWIEKSPFGTKTQLLKHSQRYIALITEDILEFTWTLQLFANYTNKKWFTKVTILALLCLGFKSVNLKLIKKMLFSILLWLCDKYHFPVFVEPLCNWI